MRPRDSLRRRVAVAYLCFTTALTLLFALIATIAVEGIEQHLVDDRLMDVAAWAGPRSSGSLPVAMPAGLSFHHGAGIPASLRGLPDGVSKLHADGVGLHVLSGRDARGPFVVVDHESDYEKVELAVYSMFALAFAVMLASALLLGRFIGNGVVAPIMTLVGAAQSGREPAELLQRRDELGVLARAWVAHSQELRGFLERERHFTGDISHELRTPLTVISGAAELLVANAGGDMAISAPAERIQRAANDAAGCIGVLLMLARTPERIAHPAIDAADIARRETERFQSLIAAKRVALRFEQGSPVLVDAAPELCAALIGNLIRNACQYTSSGSVIVGADKQSISVRDTGPGLPASAREVLAGISATAGARGDNAQSGAGLGLALVRRICEYLGATLEVSQYDGSGTLVTVHFPASLTQA